MVSGVMLFLMSLSKISLRICHYARGIPVRPYRIFGTHVQMSDVDYFQAASVKITSETPDVPVEVDGEVDGTAPLEVALAEARLRVIVP